MKPIIISGSSRKDGDTVTISNKLANILNCEVIHLSDYSINHYDYEHKNSSDDFIPLMQKLISSYDTFIFATPVYWYAMSGLMKVFFDRITDLITIEKELGRQLRGKNMAVITSSTGEHLEEQFWLPFIASANYLGMNYIENTHTISGEDNSKLISDFYLTLKNQNA